MSNSLLCKPNHETSRKSSKVHNSRLPQHKFIMILSKATYLYSILTIPNPVINPIKVELSLKRIGSGERVKSVKSLKEKSFEEILTQSTAFYK